MITKTIAELNFKDIKSLMDSKIPESGILDYKIEMISDDELIKHVSAFANTSGGHIVFGIKESGEGGHPIEIQGIDPKQISKEKIEQVILSNIFPRMQIRQHVIDHENGNQFLVLHVPDSAHKPHFNDKKQKYFKRFQFESVPMQENEISNMYRNRFDTAHEVKEYLEKPSSEFKFKEILQLEITIIPTRLDRQLIDVTNEKTHEMLNSNTADYVPSGLVYAPQRGYLRSYPKPNRFGILFNDEKTSIYLHRNGCIQHVTDMGYESDINQRQGPTSACGIQYRIFAVKLMQTLQFAEDMLSHHNYFGDVKLSVKLSSTKPTWLLKLGDGSGDHTFRLSINISHLIILCILVK